MQVDRVLEIGVESGNSLKMWEEFFPKATIYGIDVNEQCLQHETHRIKIFIGNQGDPVFLRQVIESAGGSFDIIIDDGSHAAADQIASFTNLFPALSTHGIYVIEDTGGCVNDKELVTVNKLKKCIDDIFYWPAGLDGSRWPELASFPLDATWAQRNTVGIAFYRWIIFVFRGRNHEDNPYLTAQQNPK